ncbi:histidine--tRNA ligase [Candidatus Nomurabacteria bacterium RIFCSPHIGHO2_01_FULL_38_19]|uniref:Histidine--tRNA ligase n=1 Tax=Candidatus Nomurabacteria bacterium RIFCSPHIGHO2_01_FULL_38_19 TaxID=1801732 RepID=A0A1F6URK1_9BACT|nr:MAG: histidine--tRNA ligase [Candidatus Nomurabacteria bacterium RIFCSPHIGHO2_01_FULL_38_19]
MKTFIKPKILQGTRDFLPEDMAKREYAMNKIKSAFINFGYDSVQTPAIEYAETILGKYGDEASKLVYRFKDNGGRDIALRYDQTVPFARLVATNFKNLPMPFKRYQIGPVWRGDRPAKGRYREFYQCDVDIIGTKNLLAEAEIAGVVAKVFTTIGFKNFTIKFNSRRLINSILDGLKISSEKQSSVIRILDKLKKIDRKSIIAELDPLINESTANQLLDIVSITGTTREKLELLNKYEIKEIDEFVNLARLFNIPEENLFFDPSLARGLDYYTGIIFEVFIPEVPIGAVCAGGRYDDLCSLFCPEQFSGVGVAFGFDRIIVAMEELGLFKDLTLNSQVLVTYFDLDALPASVQLLNDIQMSGINAEIYFEPAKISKQMKYADKKQIPFVVICGPEKVSRNEVTIKMMKTGRQKTIPQNQITNYFKGYNKI